MADKRSLSISVNVALSLYVEVHCAHALLLVIVLFNVCRYVVSVGHRMLNDARRGTDIALLMSVDK